MKTEKKYLSGKELFRLFLKQSAEMGSVIIYLGIVMCLVPYKAYSVMGLCLIGLVCSLYNAFNRESNTKSSTTNGLSANDKTIELGGKLTNDSIDMNKAFEYGVHEGKLREHYKDDKNSFSESNLDYYVEQNKYTENYSSGFGVRTLIDKDFKK